MLFELMIEDFALIEKLNVNFHQGLNILTGETGAGKSIIIDAVNLAIGERADKGLIRTGKDKALIQVVFYSKNPKVMEILQSNGINYYEDGLIILTREIYSSGRSSSRINDKLVTATLIKEISKYLIDIHGQHSHQSLLYSENHIDIVDMFEGEEIFKLLKIYQKKYSEFKEIKEKIKVLSESDSEKERKKDMLIFQINEIDEANLTINEDENLFSQQKILANSEKIYHTMASAYESLNNGMNNTSITDSLANIVGDFSHINGFDNKINDIYEVLQDILYRLQDIATDIRNYRDNVEFEPSLLEEIEKRLDQLNKLKRKYGNSIEEILDYREKISNELEEIESSQNRIDELSKSLVKLEKELLQLSKNLSAKRKKVAKYLEKKMNNELNTLNMGKATFKIDIKPHQSKDGNISFTQKGIDKVEFLISTNAGEPLKPLIKIVSGGEMSRIMLAIKTILANTDNIPTIIFDEIDSGISGRTANTVGEKLAIISQSHQVLCITHLPQIASMADIHFFIEKITKQKTTITKIYEIEQKDRITELARLLGGINITDLTYQHAKETLVLADKFKKKLKQ